MQPSRKDISDLLNLDWESTRNILKSFSPRDGNFYMITINKGQESEMRSPFLTYQEAADLIGKALEKKKLRVV